MKRSIKELKEALRNSNAVGVHLTFSNIEEKRANGSNRNSLDMFVVDRLELAEAMGVKSDDDDQD